MSSHSERYPRWINAVAACRQAIKCGDLTLSGRNWRFGRRTFSHSTINTLIGLGEAIRDGDIVRAA